MRLLMSGTTMMDNCTILDVLEATLQERGEIRVPAVGLSMGGWFAACDGLVIGRFRPECAVMGRIAVFRCGDRWVAHRILLRWGNRCVTKGDGVWMPDWPIPRQADMVGEVVAVVRGETRHRLDSTRALITGWLRAVAGWIEVAMGLIVSGTRRVFRSK